MNRTKQWLRLARPALLAALCFGMASCDELRDKSDVETTYRPAELKPVPPLPVEPLDVKVVAGREFGSLAEAESAVRNGASPVLQKLPIDTARLNVVHFNSLDLQNVASALTEMTGQNIVVSSEAMKTSIKVLLRDVDGRTALETICRMHNLWYRDDGGIIRIVTSDEYTKGLVIQQDEKIQVFNLRYASATSVADVIQSVFGDQVLYQAPGQSLSYGHVGTDGTDPLAVQSGGGGGGGSSASRRLGATGRNTGFTRITRETPATDALQEAVRRDVEASVLSRIMEGAEGDRPMVSESKVLEVTGQRSTVQLSSFPRNNSLIARSVDDRLLRDIGRMIESLDTPTRQVLLEVKVLEVALENDFESFFDITTKAQHFDDPPSAAGNDFHNVIKTLSGVSGVTAPTLSYALLDEHIQANIRFMESHGRLRQLQTPLVMCANNAPAEFFIGEERPIITEYEFETRDFEQRVVDVIRPISELRQIGTTVRIVPAINADGTITLRFLTELSSVNAQGASFFGVSQETGDVLELPIDTVNTTNVESIIVGKDGKTIVIGGLIRETTDRDQSKVPVVGDLPILGIPFKKDDKSKSRSEIIILILPHIMQHPTQVDAVSWNVMHNLSDHPYAQDDGRERLLDEKEANERLLIIVPNENGEGAHVVEEGPAPEPKKNADAPAEIQPVESPTQTQPAESKPAEAEKKPVSRTDIVPAAAPALAAAPEVTGAKASATLTLPAANVTPAEKSGAVSVRLSMPLPMASGAPARVKVQVPAALEAGDAAAAQGAVTVAEK